MGDSNCYKEMIVRNPCRILRNEELIRELYGDEWLNLMSSSMLRIDPDVPLLTGSSVSVPHIVDNSIILVTVFDYK